MLTKTKLMIVAALLFGSASGAMAQSYDPSIGTGNIAPVPNQTMVAPIYRGPLGAHAQVQMSFGNRTVSRPVLPFTAEEKALFDRIPKE